MPVTSSSVALNAEPRTPTHAETLAQRAEQDLEFLREYRSKPALEPVASNPTPSHDETESSGYSTTPWEESSTGSSSSNEPQKQPSRLVIWNDGGKPPIAPGMTTSDRTPDLPGRIESSRGASEVLARPEERTSPVLPSAELSKSGETSALRLQAAETEPRLTMPGTKKLDVLLVSLRRELELTRAYSDQPMRELLAMAALTLIDPEAQLNPDAFHDITEDERELLREMQGFFQGLASRLDGAHEAQETIVNAVVELQKALVQEPQLEIPAAALCWRVAGFGNFDTFSPMSFLAHSERQAILYLEVDRFTSELNSKNQWVTELSQQLEIYSDADGIPVWSEPWQRAIDVTANKRRDFFTTQKITIPQALSVGRYHFKIRVRDEKSGAEAETSIPFEMVADPKLAARVPEK